MMDPRKQLETILSQGAAQAPRFAINSRYYATPTTTLVTEDGRMIPYLQRRFAPQPDEFALLTEYTVVSSDRLDNIAATQFGDPELYWRLCDANGAMRPDELTETVGRRLRITLPAGVPGTADA
jgi:hypothetical protein